MAAEDAAARSRTGALLPRGAPLSPPRLLLLLSLAAGSLLPAPALGLLGFRPEETGAELSVADGVLKATEGTRFMLRVYYSTSPQRLNRTAATRANNAAPWVAFIEEPSPGREGQAHPKRNMCCASVWRARNCRRKRSSGTRCCPTGAPRSPPVW